MVASSTMQDVMKELSTRTRLLALIEELAALTGAPEAEAVQSALEDRLARVQAPASEEERIGKALATLRSSSRLHREAARQEKAETTDSVGAVTVDASALLAILRHGEGWEVLVRQIIVRGNARVSATALAEAGIALAAGGDFVDVLGRSEIVDALNLTVVPFTGADWRTALIEYRHRRDPNTREAPGVGYCLTAAVAARTGTRVLSGAPPAVAR